MPILETKTDHSAVRRILVATSLGGIFGFQSLKLSEYGLAACIPLYASLSIFLSDAMLGCSVGVTAGLTLWWKRGWVLGLLFSIPTALGAHAFGLRYAPYGVAMIVTGLVTGLLVAFLTDTLVPFNRKSARQPSEVLPPSSRPESPHALERKMDPIRQRLAETLNLELDRVSVKFKTAEKVGPVGEGRSAEAQAVVSLHKLGSGPFHESVFPNPTA